MDSIALLILTPIALLVIIGIWRKKAEQKKERADKIEKEEVIVVTHRNKKIAMRKEQKEVWDQLSRAQKTHFLSMSKEYKVKK